MKFTDLNDNREYTAKDLFAEWLQYHDMDPENFPDTFRAYILNVVLATINGRNDLEVRGLTHREIRGVIRRIRAKG